MALMKKTQRSFSGGMLDKDLMGRQDLAKYSQGCLVLENFKVRKQGNAIKRSGTDLVCDFTLIKGSGGAIVAAKLIPLVQERESGFYILITGARAYLVSPQGVRMNDGTWSRAPAHAASPSTLAPYSISVPFTDADLQTLDWCQSGDTIFTAHRSYAPGRIVYSNGTLEYTQITFRQGLGIAPRISSVAQQGTGWTGTGGLVHVEYAVTAVKDGVETGMSVPFATEYNAPWPSEGSILITIDTSSLPQDSWDHFNIYKKEADVFGLIGTTSGQHAFVDIRNTDGTLSIQATGGNDDIYPAGFTGLDFTTHARESNDVNKFATCWYMKAYWSRTATAAWQEVDNIPSANRLGPYSIAALPGWMDSVTALGPSNSWDSTEETIDGTPISARSATASIKTTSITYSPGKALTSFRVRLGTLYHDTRRDRHIEMFISVPFMVFGDGSFSYDSTWPNQVTASDAGMKWSGNYTEFTPSPAKYYKARMTFTDSTSVVITSRSATAAIDQTAFPQTGWTESGGVYRHTYTDDELMYSYDFSALVERMDARAPSVAAGVWFDVPAEYADKTVATVVITGYSDEGCTVQTSIVVNGIACYRDGKYVGTFTDNYITPDLTITPPKTEDHFVNPGEYPGCVQLYSQRLVYAASAKEPFTFWMSATGDLYNFDVHEYIRASDSIKASTAALEMPRINRMLVHRDLMLFAEGGEWQVAPSTGNAVAPSTVAAKLQSTVGCAAWLKPIPIDSDIVFCDSSGETLMATRYNFASDGYESSNLSVLSQRLFRNNPIRAMAYVQFPESTIECVLADGTVASLVYMREHDVCAWSHHVLGGGWQARDVAANKSVAAGSSHCAFLASRQYNAGTTESPSIATKWAILALRDIDPNDETLAGNLRMDAVRTVETTRAADATEPTPPSVDCGETAVRIGQRRETDTTDPEHPVTTITDIWAVGCAFKSVLKTTSPEFTDKETAQMEVKNATESEVRVIDGSDFTVRQPEVPAAKATHMKVSAQIGTDAADFTVMPGDADCRMPLVGTNSKDGSIVIEHNGYLPLAVLSVTTSYRVEFANHANGGSGDGRD